MKNTNTCIRINSIQELEAILKKKDSMFIVFYAPWCGFSQRFLPIFEKCALDTSRQCYRMEVDELPRLCEKYQIDVFPTVIFFENGKPVQRLDGTHGVGLNEQQFRELISVCESRPKT
jgi:thioredoxin-like negative regulator of GroEL